MFRSQKNWRDRRWRRSQPWPWIRDIAGARNRGRLRRMLPAADRAGVLGMARTNAAPHTSEIEAMVVPAMIDTTSVEGPVKDFSIAAGLAKRRGVQRDHQRRGGADICRRWIETNTPFVASALISSEGMRLDHDDAPGIQPLRQPAPTATHRPSSRAGEHDGVFDILQSVGGVRVIRKKYPRRPGERRDP